MHKHTYVPVNGPTTVSAVHLDPAKILMTPDPVDYPEWFIKYASRPPFSPRSLFPINPLHFTGQDVKIRFNHNSTTYAGHVIDTDDVTGKYMVFDENAEGVSRLRFLHEKTFNTLYRPALAEEEDDAPETEPEPEAEEPPARTQASEDCQPPIQAGDILVVERGDSTHLPHIVSITSVTDTYAFAESDLSLRWNRFTQEPVGSNSKKIIRVIRDREWRILASAHAAGELKQGMIIGVSHTPKFEAPDLRRIDYISQDGLAISGGYAYNRKFPYDSIYSHNPAITEVHAPTGKKWLVRTISL